jgi:stage IV sporulation protein FB
MPCGCRFVHREFAVFFSDAPSPFDLHFRVFGIPVRVQPWFWLIMALLGSSNMQEGLEFVVIWVLCGFVSVLVHELGHALAYRIFGSRSAITLHGFGGYAETNNPPYHAWQRLIVYAAGPGAGFALVGVVVVSAMLTGWPARNAYLMEAYFDLWFMGVFWGILNLLPIWPLDGGRMTREVLVLLRIRNADMRTHQISIFFALLLVTLALVKMLRLNVPALDPILPFVPTSLMLTIWLGLFAYQNWQMLQIHLQQRNFYDRYDDDSPPWRR